MSANRLADDAHIAFGAVTNAFVAALTPTGPMSLLMINNTTDKAIRVSFDGTKYFVLGIGAGVVLDLAIDGLESTSPVSIRDDGSSPTSGTVHLFCMYRA